MTKVFVEQPLASPGSAKKVKLFWSMEFKLHSQRPSSSWYVSIQSSSGYWIVDLLVLQKLSTQLPKQYPTKILVQSKLCWTYLSESHWHVLCTIHCFVVWWQFGRYVFISLKKTSLDTTSLDTSTYWQSASPQYDITPLLHNDTTS